MNRLVLAAIVMGAGLAGVVRADDPGSTSAPLSGPKVDDKGIPGENKTFGKTGSKLKREVRLIDDRILMQAVGTLRGGAVKDDVRLTPEQETVIHDANEKIVTARRDYLMAHEGEIKSALTDLGIDSSKLKGERGLREAFEKARQMREGGKPTKGGAEPNADDAMSADAKARRAAAVQTLAQLRDQAPKPDDAHAAIWAALTNDQKTIVQAKIKELQDQQEAKRALPGARQKAAKKIQKNQAPPAGTNEGVK